MQRGLNLMRMDERQEARGGRNGTESGRQGRNPEEKEAETRGNEILSDPPKGGNSQGRSMNYHMDENLKAGCPDAGLIFIAGGWS
jgi:hypothetical protein